MSDEIERLLKASLDDDFDVDEGIQRLRQLRQAAQKGPNSEGAPDASGGGSAGQVANMAKMRQDFLDFFDIEYALVVRFVMRMGAGLPDAEDAMQHVAEQGWRMVNQGGWSSISHPRAWARKVALNHYRSQHRKIHSEVLRPVDTDATLAVPGHADLVGQARDLLQLLQLLDEDCRAVIAFDLDDVPGPQIAAMLAKTPEQVRDLRKKARRQLARHLAHSDTRQKRVPTATDSNNAPDNSEDIALDAFLANIDAHLLNHVRTASTGP